MNQPIDIIICSLPSLSLDRVPGAPALLKAAAESAGYSALGVDLSIRFFVNQCANDVATYNEMCCAFRPYEHPSAAASKLAEDWINDSIELFKQHQPKLIGLSVFTSFQHRACLMLARAIRQKLPNVKIVLGGYGLPVNSNGLLADDKIKKLDLLSPFNLLMEQQGLSDYTVLGDGLNQLIDILGIEIGFNRNVTYEEQGALFDWPMPNYDDYDLDLYLFNVHKSLPVTGSKGCVRQCTFCEIPGIFGKFKYRSGQSIADELIHLHKTYGVQVFEFTDSLVNGSLKAFEEWLTIVADYNDLQTEENKIRWFGQYICRPQKTIPKNIYSLMNRAGVTTLIIGVESGSDTVLAAMNKKMTSGDVLDELVKFEEYNIKAHFLMLGGYYNETWERYLETLSFIVKCHKYVARGVIERIDMGIPLFINDKVQLHHDADRLGIILDPYDDLNWRVEDDLTNDFVERSRRRLITQLLLDSMGVAQANESIINMKQVLSSLKNYEKKLLNVR